MSHPYDLGDKKQTSILGPTLKFKGELTANEDLVIQGQIEGSIKHTSNLTIGEEGKLKADVVAEHISVEGKIDGDLEGRNSVVVKNNANVAGNIYSPVVTLHEGATFNGRIDMSGDAKPQEEKPPKEAKKDERKKPAEDKVEEQVEAAGEEAANDESNDKKSASRKRAAGSSS